MTSDDYAFVHRSKRTRISVSLRPELVAWVRATAERNAVPISSVVELALRRAKDRSEAPR